MLTWMTVFPQPGGTAQNLAWPLGLAVPMLVVAWLAPPLLPWLIGGMLGAGALGLAWCYLTQAWVLWLVIAGLSLEMALSDLIGPEAFQVTIAAVKGTEIGLVSLTILRHGFVFDRYNPGWAFVAMAGIGAAAGLHPGLTMGDMTRSAIGSITPFLLFFCAVPAGWGEALRRAVSVTPLAAVGLGLVCDLTGLRPLFVDSGGMRLAALGHPAFLAGVCLPAIYATLLWWLREGSGRAAALLGANLTILVLTGARAPMAYAILVVAVSLLLAPEAAVPRAHRLVVCAAGLVALPFLLVVGESVGSLRLFTVISGEAGHMSGRDLLWPAFREAAAQAPWVGWGLGAGNVVIPHQGAIAKLLHTWAAHNEYLRLQVEGGHVGRSLLIGLFVVWVARHTGRLPRRECLVMRVIFLAYAAHAATDNVLISTPACVFFAFTAAIFADGGTRSFEANQTENANHPLRM